MRCCNLCIWLAALLTLTMLTRIATAFVKGPRLRNSPVLRARTQRLHAGSRLPADALTLDAHLLATNPDLVAGHLLSRHADPIIVSEVNRIHGLRQQRSDWIKQGDTARSTRKALSKDIGSLLKAGSDDEVKRLKLQVERCSEQTAKAEAQQALIDQQIDSILASMPNLLDSRVPEGAGDADNVEVHRWEPQPRKLGEGCLWHDELARGLGGCDMEAAAKMAGTRFSVLVGQLARLERALGQFFLDFHTARGSTEVAVPLIVSRSTLQGTGQLPKFEDDLFKVNHSVAGEDAFLIPTAEVPLTNLFRDSILSATQLPVRLVSLTPCFRAEAGSYGRDTRGLLRQHQFQKVELVRICEPERSAAEHAQLVADAEALLQALELPYRCMLLCAGDTGFSARICYDLEVWLPGQQAYREISSISNCYDFQARRMMLRYRADAGSGKKVIRYAHTLNGSGLAVGRALVAVLENYQLPDGSVSIPAVLRPYMGGLDKLVPTAIRADGFLYK